MTKFPNKFKKPCFSPIFGAKIIFLENAAWSYTTSYGFLAPCQNLEKVNDTIQRKWLDRRKDRQFYRTLPATTGGSKKMSIKAQNTTVARPCISKKNLF